MLHIIILLGDSPERLVFMLDKRLQRLVFLLVTITLVIATYGYSVFSTTDEPILAQVRNVVVATKENSIVLSWDIISYSDGYEVLGETQNGVSIFEVKDNTVSIPKDYIKSCKVRCYKFLDGTKAFGAYSQEQEIVV